MLVQANVPVQWWFYAAKACRHPPRRRHHPLPRILRSEPSDARRGSARGYRTTLANRLAIAPCQIFLAGTPNPTGRAPCCLAARATPCPGGITTPGGRHLGYPTRVFPGPPYVESHSLSGVSIHRPYQCPLPTICTCGYIAREN